MTTKMQFMTTKRQLKGPKKAPAKRQELIIIFNN